MPLALSIVLRVLWFGWVFSLGFIGMLAVAFGFSGGVGWISWVMLAIYIVTVVPALIVGFLPWPKLRHPSWPLKLWYGWMALVFGSYFLLQAFGATLRGIARSATAFDEWGHSQEFTTLCWRGEGADDNGIVFGLGDASSVRMVRATAAGECRRFQLSEAPRQVMYWSSAKHEMQPRLDIPREAGDSTCIVVGYENTIVTSSERRFWANVEPCLDSD